jgi:hypothetical protein
LQCGLCPGFGPHPHRQRQHRPDHRTPAGQWLPFVWPSGCPRYRMSRANGVPFGATGWSGGNAAKVV